MQKEPSIHTLKNNSDLKQQRSSFFCIILGIQRQEMKRKESASYSGLIYLPLVFWMLAFLSLVLVGKWLYRRVLSLGREFAADKWWRR